MNITIPYIIPIINTYLIVNLISFYKVVSPEVVSAVYLAIEPINVLSPVLITIP